jgi:hypothetical protein
MFANTNLKYFKNNDRDSRKLAFKNLNFNIIK